MEIMDLSHNDDLLAVVRKCNANFKQLYYTLTQSSRKQLRIENQDVSEALQALDESLIELQNVVMPNAIADAIAALDVPGQIADAIDQALDVTVTNTMSDFFTEDGCTVTACNAMRWGNMAFIRFSYRFNSTLTVPSNGDITDVTLGKLKIGWRPFDMTNVILDQTKILIGDVNSSGDVKVRSANSRGTSYTIDANTVLYASMMLMLGLQ